MSEETTVKVTLTRADDMMIALQYLASGELIQVHEHAEDRAVKLQGLKVGQKVLVGAEEVHTGNSVHTSITKE